MADAVLLMPPYSSFGGGSSDEGGAEAFLRKALKGCQLPVFLYSAAGEREERETGRRGGRRELGGGEVEGDGERGEKRGERDTWERVEKECSIPPSRRFLKGAGETHRHTRDASSRRSSVSVSGVGS